MSTDKLMQAFQFTEADLDLNRQGRLSESQRRQLHWTQRVFRAGTWVAEKELPMRLAAFAIVLGLAAVLGLYEMSRVSPLTALFVITMLAGGVAFLAWKLTKYAATVEAGRVEQITEAIRIGESQGNALLMIGDHLEFRVTLGQVIALRDGDIYSAYVFPGSGWLDKPV